MIAVLHNQLSHLALISQGDCDLWKPQFVWIDAATNSLLALAYFSSLVGLLYWTRQRRDFLPAWIIQLIGSFLLATGFVYGLEIWALWHPLDWLAAGLKLVTAALAIATTGALLPLIPKVLNLPDRNEAERKASEQAVQESNARLSNLAANIPGAVFRYVLRPDGSNAVLYMSPGCYDLWEVEAQTAKADATVLWQMVHPEDVAAMHESVLQSARTLQPWSYSWRITTPSGRQKWLEAAGRPELQSNGDVIWDTVTLDVTARKQSEIALQQSEIRLQLALEASGEGLWDWNMETGAVYLNARYQEMLGYAPGELVMNLDTWSQMIHPDDQVRAVECLQAHIKDQSVQYTFDYRLRCRSGQWKWIANYGRVFEYDAQGKPSRMVGIHIDINDRKTTERALQLQRDFNQLIAEITSRLVNLSPDTLDPEIEQTLRLISEITQADTSYLFRFDDDSGIMSMTHEWCQPHCPRHIHLAQKIPLNDFPWTVAQLKQREIVHVPEVNALPDAIAIDRANWQRFNLVSVLSVPLIERTGVVGMIGFASLSQPVTWEEEIIRLLTILGQAIANTQQQVQDEQQLSISEERLRLALAAANQGLYDVNVQTGDVIVSPEYALMLGYDPATFQETATQWVERLHPEDREPVAATYQAYVAGTLPEYKVEFRLRTRSGDYKWILSLGRVVAWDAAGRALRMLGTHTDISDRKQAETQLRDLTYRLGLAVQAAKMGVWDLDMVNHRLTWDDRIYEFYGVPREVTPTYAVWESVVYPEDLSQCHTRVQQDLANHKTEGMTEFRVQRPDGSFRHLVSSYLIQRDDDGQPQRMIGVNLDISDRKAAEAERIKAEEARLQAEKLRLELNLLERTLDSVLAGYWDSDFSQQLNYWSPGLKRMFGYQEDELPDIPETWQSLIFAEDLPVVQACFERHVQSHGKEPYYNEVRYHHRNGSTVWVICAGQVIEWDAAGHPLRMVGCHVDITKLKATEAQLQKSDAHLRQAQRIGKLGSWEFDLVTGEITWSEQVFRLFGRDPASGPPQSFEALQQLIHPEDRDFHQRTVQTTLETHQPYDIECRICRSDGTLAYMQARGEAVLDPAGQLIQLTGTVLDITERKQIEARLLETTAQLQSSNRELEAFAYSVSHDLRAPLRAIDGFSKALLEDYGEQFDAEGKDYFDRIRHNVQRMGMLIDDLLSLSRISRYEMQLRPINLSQLVQDQAAELQASEPTRLVEFVIAPDVRVAADPTLMSVAIANLMANAWKFTSHHASARIEFGIMRQNEQPVYFVRDDGAGFDMAYAAKLFGVFQRLHNTDEFPGTGIGLATVQRAIHRHGGQVWAESTVEQGATIYFTIPTSSMGINA